MNLQPIYDIAEICAQQGISHGIVCPGSRCAPLTLAFTRHPKLTIRTISDERSAAFIGLGIAEQTKSPVVLVCTSGSAAYNFAPAVAEAFFQHIPLIVFTADRPPEWIDQLDGQTIRQENIYGRHVKRSYQLPVDYENTASQWHVNRVVNEAILTATEFPAGPVHINIPFREPFYPGTEKLAFNDQVRVIARSITTPQFDKQELERLQLSISGYSKILLVVGQDDLNENLIQATERFCQKNHAAIVGDVISNFHSAEHIIKHADAFLGQCGKDVKASLKPELLITFGKSIISKNTKQFLRSFPPHEHWHIQATGEVADTYQHLTRCIRMEPAAFFKAFAEPVPQEAFNRQKKENYALLWEAEEHRAALSIERFLKEDSFDELSIVQKIMAALPLRCNLHLANSMSVRYANMIGLEASKRGIRVFCNRGTSGIDGSNSTAVGHALSSDIPNFLITGDMAFFYDRNAFWNTHHYPNLHIAVMNNHGGHIFGLIDGPSSQPELAEYFITKQKLSAEHLAKEFDFTYFKLDSAKKVKSALYDFFEFDHTTKILEVLCDPAISKERFENFRKQIKKGYES